ncbi:MAG: hypothetical protein KAV00_00345 [Phycisphaerae bacterium]|nr:hypothetical protein [Phycisphaerae bacterium]
MAILFRTGLTQRLFTPSVVILQSPSTKQSDVSSSEVRGGIEVGDMLNISRKGYYCEFDKE